MARIKIEDLPVLEDMSPKEAKGIFGGLSDKPLPSEKKGNSASDLKDANFSWSEEVYPLVVTRTGIRHFYIEEGHIDTELAGPTPDSGVEI